VTGDSREQNFTSECRQCQTVTSRFINAGVYALTWESFPDDSLACCGGTGDIRRGVISDSDRQGPPFIGQMVAVLDQRASPAGDWRGALPL
jgi:hypothetical protein